MVQEGVWDERSRGWRSMWVKKSMNLAQDHRHPSPAVREWLISEWEPGTDKPSASGQKSHWGWSEVLCTGWEMMAYLTRHAHHRCTEAAAEETAHQINHTRSRHRGWHSMYVECGTLTSESGWSHLVSICAGRARHLFLAATSWMTVCKVCIARMVHEDGSTTCSLHAITAKLTASYHWSFNWYYITTIAIQTTASLVVLIPSAATATTVDTNLTAVSATTAGHDEITFFEIWNIAVVFVSGR